MSKKSESDTGILYMLEDLIEDAVEKAIALAIEKKYTKKQKKECKRLYALILKHVNDTNFRKVYKERIGKVLE